MKEILAKRESGGWGGLAGGMWQRNRQRRTHSVYGFEITRSFPLSHKKQRKSIARVGRRVKCASFGMPLEWYGIDLDRNRNQIEWNRIGVRVPTHTLRQSETHTRSNTQINRGAERHYSHGTPTPMQASAPLWSSALTQPHMCGSFFNCMYSPCFPFPSHVMRCQNITNSGGISPYGGTL